jgi:hypothetical protein
MISDIGYRKTCASQKRSALYPNCHSLLINSSNSQVFERRLGFGLGTSSVSTELVLGNRYGSVGTTEIENRIFGYFFLCLSRTCSGGSGFYIRLNLLGVTQSVFFMVPEETQTSTSSTAAGIASRLGENVGNR